MAILEWLLSPEGLTPHGYCLSWTPGLIWLHAGADALIGLAYFSIPLAIAAFVARRKDLKYSWVANLFVAFILACGTTHILAILTLWIPAYGFEAVVKVVTAGLSVATAALLWPLIPRLLALPSAAELERRVAERTAQLTTANAQLQEALEQRDLLLREVYHRVKNNLQIVDGLIVMQGREVADAGARRALNGLRQRVHALGLVHNQLMGSDDLQTLDIEPFLADLTANLAEGAAAQGVQLNVRSLPLRVGLDFAIPLGLLVTELVTNALKHAFPGGQGRIEVVLERDAGGEVMLIVADDGIGYDPNRQQADGRPALGTSIIQGLVAQLRGRFDVQQQGGTRNVVHLAAPAAA
ncbi:sensor histidine kinase [Zavarzinia sp. CC-PAN008]|uniref:sensor histidine kinase n=1 Tax=Zavarzinia sp. CC-PAN008 TaxID=3243332 RepID=UPI003F748026